MKKDVKQVIINEAIRLLNEKGLGHVKIRDVALKVGISIGNLTYHFPKWEDLLDAIIKDYRYKVESLIKHFPADLADVVDYVDMIYKAQKHYHFLFSNFALFFHLYPKYEGLRMSLINDREIEMTKIIEGLIEKGLVHPASRKHDYNLVVYNIWFFLSGWNSFARIYRFGEAESRDLFLRSIWNISVYHLTAKGRKVVIKAYRKQ